MMGVKKEKPIKAVVLSRNNMLADLAGRIQIAETAMAESSQKMAEQALVAGRLLLEAKEACKHGEWLQFLAMAGTGERQAQRLMTLARSGLKSDTVSELGIRGALQLIAKRRLPESGKVLIVSAPVRSDGEASIDAGDHIACVWECPLRAGYFNILIIYAGQALDIGDASVSSTKWPVSREQESSIFRLIDTELNHLFDRMSFETQDLDLFRPMLEDFGYKC
jgi:hypothetical protein